MADRPNASADRPPVHATRGASRLFAVRLKVPDAARLDSVLDTGGIGPADYLRSLIIRDLDARTAPAAAPME